MPIINVYQRLKEIFLGLLIILGVLTIPLIRSWSDPFAGSKTIYVSAEGKTTATPDVASISFGVVTEGKNPEDIQVDNNNRVKEAVSFIKGEGIAPADIKTTSYNLSPKYEYDEKKHTSFINGYTLSQTVLTKIRDLSKVAKVLGGISELRINQINSVVFGVDDPERYLAEARNQAFDKAHEKAKAMAEKNGVKLGRVINFSESQGGLPVPVYSTLEGGKGGGVEAPAPLIEPGSEEVKIQVTVTYEIE